MNTKNSYIFFLFLLCIGALVTCVSCAGKRTFRDDPFHEAQVVIRHENCTSLFNDGKQISNDARSLLLDRGVVELSLMNNNMAADDSSVSEAISRIEIDTIEKTRILRIKYYNADPANNFLDTLLAAAYEKELSDLLGAFRKESDQIETQLNRIILALDSAEKNSGVSRERREILEKEYSALLQKKANFSIAAATCLPSLNIVRPPVFILK